MTRGTPHSIRQLCRSGQLRSPTPGLAPGYLQANLVVLPSSVERDFHDLCKRNPVACPLLCVSKTRGNPHSLTPAEFSPADLDIRTDLPSYNIYKDGQLIGSKDDIMNEWTEDHVAFLIGCSFSFEAALVRGGLTPRHIEQGSNVPIYRTTLPLNPAGIFDNATCVVSMRPYKPDTIEKVRSLTRPFLKTHGEPIAWGWESCQRLGILNIDKPDFGDAVPIRDGEIPVFWGCGVTPQVAIMSAGDKISGTVVTHKPGHMLLLDVQEDSNLTR